MTVVGVHLPNRHLELADGKLYCTMRAEGALVMPYHKPTDLIAMGVQPANSIVRLEDVVRDGRLPSWWELAGEWEATIRKFVPNGFRRFQLDNEPELAFAHARAGGDKPWQVWRWLVNNALNAMLPRLVNLPPVEFGYTPHSHPETHLEWWHEGRSIRDRCAWVANHSYWQREEHMSWAIFGSGFEWIRRQMDADREPAKPIYITECGNSSIQNNPPPSLVSVEAEQVNDYPKYIRHVAQFDYVRGLYFFILGGTEDWRGFNLTEPIARSIGSRA